MPSSKPRAQPPGSSRRRVSRRSGIAAFGSRRCILNWTKPPPLVPRRLRREAREKVGPRGDVRLPLDEASVVAACERLAEENVAAVAIAYLHAYANPAHEQRSADIAREVLGTDVFITCSSDILPEIREYERTSTTVINAYLGPILSGHFVSLQRHLKQIDVTAPVQVMKSDGGHVGSCSDAKAGIYRGVRPAAGVIGAARLDGTKNIITLDMGGTTAKASMVEHGQVAHRRYEVGAGKSLEQAGNGRRLSLKLPVIDISEIGAGGGSIVSLDRGGLVKVGPESAGAVPGPVCYGRGGEEPTFTDSVLTLGYLNPGHLVGGDLQLDANRARQVLENAIAKPIERDLLEPHGAFFRSPAARFCEP